MRNIEDEVAPGVNPWVGDEGMDRCIRYAREHGFQRPEKFAAFYCSIFAEEWERKHSSDNVTGKLLNASSIKNLGYPV